MYGIATRGTSFLTRPFLKRRNSSPYLSQDFFRSISDVYVRDYKSFSRTSLQEMRSAKVIYCPSHQLEDFLSSESRLITAKLVFSGGTDFEFHEFESLALGRIKKLYLQNSFISDNNRVYTLPIGLEDLSLALNGFPFLVSSKVVQKEKNNKILVGPFSPTHSVRQRIIRLSRACPSCFTVEKQLSPVQNARLSGKYRFIACPRGAGEDTHRLWESIYRNSIPIVLRTPWSNSIQALGIPVIELTSWNQLCNLQLDSLYDAMKFEARSHSVLWAPFWQKVVEDCI